MTNEPWTLGPAGSAPCGRTDVHLCTGKTATGPCATPLMAHCTMRCPVCLDEDSMWYLGKGPREEETGAPEEGGLWCCYCNDVEWVQGEVTYTQCGKNPLPWEG